MAKTEQRSAHPMAALVAAVIVRTMQFAEDQKEFDRQALAAGLCSEERQSAVASAMAEKYCIEGDEPQTVPLPVWVAAGFMAALLSHWSVIAAMLAYAVVFVIAARAEEKVPHAVLG